MLSIGSEEIRRLAPRAQDEYVDAITKNWGDIDFAEINTPLRVCHFLAQAMHETGGLRIFSENMNYSAKRMAEVWPTRFGGALKINAVRFANNPAALGDAVYGKRLGNTDKGDGFRYRGRGFFQDTGKSSYEWLGEELGMDLVSHPDLLEQPSISIKAAAVRWRKQKLNQFADWNYGVTIGNSINRGNPYSSMLPIGHDSRAAWFARLWVLFGDGEIANQAFTVGARGPRVRDLQSRLRDLRYAVGAPDGVFGPQTGRMVVAFKLDHQESLTASGADKQEPSAVVGPLTLAVMDGAEPISYGDRALATEKDLAAKGSTEVREGQRSKQLGAVVTVAAVGKAASETGMLDVTRQSIEWVPQAQAMLVPVVGAAQWAYTHFVWVIGIGFGVWFWTRGRRIIEARLKAHRNGWNLWR